MSEFKLMCAALDAVDRALQREVLNEGSWEDRASDKEILDHQWEESERIANSDVPTKCLSCIDLKDVYDFPMGEYEGFGSVFVGERCTRKGGCDRA
jgi:hypothetical protein